MYQILEKILVHSKCSEGVSRGDENEDSGNDEDDAGGDGNYVCCCSLDPKCLPKAHMLKN